MKIDQTWLRNFVLKIVKPLKVGKTVTQSGTKATLNNLYPDGQGDSFAKTSPFGFIAFIPPGVTAFYQELYGSGYEPIMLAELHAARPQPASPGDVILYSTDGGGASVQCKITIGSNGIVQVQATEIDLGVSGLEKILNGETFQTFFNSHQHTGNMGVPTSGPLTPSGASHLSSVVKAAK